MTTMTLPLTAAMTVESANGHSIPTLPAHTAPPPALAAAQRTAPQRVLGDSRGERRIVALIGTSVLALALTGMYVSFRTVYAYVLPYFHGTAWAVPSGVDLAILVFSAADLMLMYWDIPMPGLRLVPWAFTAATIALNWQSGGPLPIRIAHAAMPSLWVIFCEYARHVIRHRVGLVAGTRMEKIRKSRWLLAPWSTARMWRRMILWEITDYRAALTVERRRLGAVAVARELHGRRWRTAVGGLLRLEINNGEAGPEDVRPPCPAPSLDVRADEPPRPAPAPDEAPRTTGAPTEALPQLPLTALPRTTSPSRPAPRRAHVAGHRPDAPPRPIAPGAPASDQERAALAALHRQLTADGKAISQRTVRTGLPTLGIEVTKTRALDLANEFNAAPWGAGAEA